MLDNGKSATGSTDSNQQMITITDRLDPTDHKDNVRTESRLRAVMILSERDTEFILSILSKINKSVVTVRRGHFMNSRSVNRGIYSCHRHGTRHHNTQFYCNLIHVISILFSHKYFFCILYPFVIFSPLCT